MAIQATFTDTSGNVWKATAKSREHVPVWLCDDDMTFVEIFLSNDIPCIEYSNGDKTMKVTSSQIVEAYYDSSNAQNSVETVFGNELYGKVTDITQEQIDTLKKAVDFPVSLLPLAFDGSVTESSERVKALGRDILVDGSVRYTEVLDTMGVNNGITMTLLKNEGKGNTELVKRRALSALDIVLDNHKFIRTSTLGNQVPKASDLGLGIRNCGILTPEISKSAGYGSISGVEGYSLVNGSSGFSSKKSGILLKGYAKSPLDFLRSDVGSTKPHIFICRDGKVLLLRPLSDNVQPEQFVPNDSVQPSELGNLLVIGLETRNPFEVTTGRYFDPNESGTIASEIAQVRLTKSYSTPWGSGAGLAIPMDRNDGDFYQALIDELKPHVKSLEDLLKVNPKCVSYDTYGDNAFEFDTWKLVTSVLPKDLDRLMRYFEPTVPVLTLTNWNEWRQPKGLAPYSVAREALNELFAKKGDPEISEVLRKIERFAEAVPQPAIDYSHWFEYSKGDTVSMLHKRREGLTDFQKKFSQSIPSELDRKAYLQTLLSIENPFTPYVSSKYQLDLQQGDWYADNANTIVQDYDLSKIYGSEDEVSAFGESQTSDADNNLARSIGNRSTHWNEIFSRKHMLVDDRGRDLYQLTEDCQIADRMLSDFSKAFEDLYAGAEVSTVTDISKIRETFRNVPKISKTIAKTTEDINLGFNHVSARTASDILRFCFEASNYHFSKKSGLAIGRSHAFPSFTVRREISYTQTEAIVPDWDREVAMWIGGSLQSPYINFDMLRGVSLESGESASRRLSIRLLMDELVTTSEDLTSFDPYPETVEPKFTEDGTLFTLKNDTEFNGVQFHRYLIGNAKSQFMQIAKDGLFITKGFKESYDEVVNGRLVPELDSSASFSEIAKSQSNAFKRSGYFKGEAWKVMNPAHEDIFEVAVNSRRWFSSRLTDWRSDTKLGSSESTKKTVSALVAMGLFQKKKGLPFRWSPTDINHWNSSMTLDGLVPTKDIVKTLSPNGSKSEKNVEALVGLFAGLGGLRQENLAGIGVAFESVTSHSHSPNGEWHGDSYGSTTHLKQLSQSWGWLTYHLMLPVFSEARGKGTHLPHVLDMNHKLLFDMVGKRSIYDVTSKNPLDRLKSDFIACMVHEYDKIFAMDERVRSYHVGQSFWANIAKPACWGVQLPSVKSLVYTYGWTRGGLLGLRTPSSPVTTKTNREESPQFDDAISKTSGYEYVVNEDPHALFSLHRFCETKGDLTDSSMLKIYKGDDLYIYQGKRSSDYNLRMLKGSAPSVDSYMAQKNFLSKQGVKPLGDILTLVTNLTPFRPSMNAIDMLSNRHSDEYNGTGSALEVNCQFLENSPFFKGFFGNVNVTADFLRTTNLNRPVYVSKMPRDYCISPLFRDAVYEAFSATTGLNEHGASLKQDAEIFEYVFSRSINLWHDHFAYFIDDLADNLADLPNFLNGGLFGDQVIGGYQISELAKKQDGINDLLNLIDAEALSRMNQRFWKLTSPNDTPFNGIHDDILYVVGDTTDDMAGIANFLFKLGAVYEIIMELKNSAFNMTMDIESTKNVFVMGDVKDPTPLALSEVMAMTYSNFFKSMPDGLTELAKHVADIPVKRILDMDYSKGTFEGLNYVPTFHVPRPAVTFPSGIQVPYVPLKLYGGKKYRQDAVWSNYGEFDMFATDDMFYPIGFHDAYDNRSDLLSSQKAETSVAYSDLWFSTPEPTQIEVTEDTGASHLSLTNFYRLVPNGSVFRSDVVSKWTVDNAKNIWDSKIDDLKKFILSGSGSPSTAIGGFKVSSFSTPLKTILKSGGELDGYYENNQRHSILTNYPNPFIVNMTYVNMPLVQNLAWEISWNLESQNGKRISKLGYLAGTDITYDKVSEGFVFEPLRMVDVNTKNYDRILNLSLLTSQIWKWSNRKKLAVSSLLNFEGNSTQMLCTTGFSEWHRGFRFFARPTKAQAKSLGSVIDALSCELGDVAWAGIGDRFIGGDLVDMVDDGGKTYIFTTDCVSKNTVEFGLHWFEVFDGLGFNSGYKLKAPYVEEGLLEIVNGDSSRTYPEKVIQHNRQPFSLLIDAEDVLAGRPKYRVFYGMYVPPSCEKEIVQSVKEPTTTKKPDCVTAGSTPSLVKYKLSNHMVPWKQVFEGSLDEILAIDSNKRDFSTEHKYVDTTNSFGILVSPAEESMKDSIQ